MSLKQVFNNKNFLITAFAIIITFQILFFSVLIYHFVSKPSKEKQKLCVIEENFGPSGEAALIEDIIIEKTCYNSNKVTTYCLLGFYDTKEKAKLAGAKQNCIFGSETNE